MLQTELVGVFGISFSTSTCHDRQKKYKTVQYTHIFSVTWIEKTKKKIGKAQNELSFDKNHEAWEPIHTRMHRRAELMNKHIHRKRITLAKSILVLARQKERGTGTTVNEMKLPRYIKNKNLCCPKLNTENTKQWTRIRATAWKYELYEAINVSKRSKVRPNLHAAHCRNAPAGAYRQGE